MKKPTPEEYVIRYSCMWRKTQQELIAARPDEKEEKKSIHRNSERRLGMAVDFLMKKQTS